MSVAVPLVAAVCGSRGDTSANRLLLDAFVEIAGERVRVASSFDVADVPHFDPDAVDDPPDAVARWRAHLDAADALVLAVPSYRGLLETSLSIRSPLANLVAQVDSVVYLVTRPLLTLRLNFDPDLVAREAIDAAWLAKAGALAALVALGVARMRARPWLAILWFALALAPTHGPLARYELANDRQLYLAIVGPALIVGVALASWSARAAANAALASLAILLGAATFVRVTDYASEARLWEATVRASPGNARAWNNLGYARQLEGDRVRARAGYERALAIDPGNRKARFNVDALGPP
jgi:tetratricopeptide (TPR) repeat protein